MPKYDIFLGRLRQREDFGLSFTPGIVQQKLTDECVYAYLSTPANTVMTNADTWYFFQGTFANTILENFELTAEGIKYIGQGTNLEIEWKTDGQSDKAATIKIGIVKNGTFTDGVLTDGEILPGSLATFEADTVGATNGKGGLHSLIAIPIETNDILSLVISSDVAATTWTPETAAASAQKFH